MPYPILRVSGAPTRVPVRAQRGPCSPRLLPLGLGLLLDFYRRPASEVSCPRSSKPQGAGDEGSRARATVSRGQAGVETVLAQEWARQVGPDPDVEDWGWYPDWRGDRPPGWWARVTARTGTGEDMWVHADVVAGVVGATTSAVAPAGWPEDEAAGDIIECPDGCRVIGRGAWTGTDRPTIAAALFQALVRAGAALDRSQP